MGNRVSVSPYESSAVSKEKPKAQQYREEGPNQTTSVAGTSPKRNNNESPPKIPSPQRNEISPAGSTKAAEVVDEPSQNDIKVTEAAPVTPRTETVPKKSVDYQEHAPAADAGAAIEGDRPTADGGTDLHSSHRETGAKQLNPAQQTELDESRRNISNDLQQQKKAGRRSGEYRMRRRRVSTEETMGSEENTSDSSGSESYTSSSCSSGSDESGDDASDDTFFVPAVSPDSISSEFLLWFETITRSSLLSVQQRLRRPSLHIHLFQGPFRVLATNTVIVFGLVWPCKRVTSTAVAPFVVQCSLCLSTCCRSVWSRWPQGSESSFRCWVCVQYT